jgi:hypothetical protein
MKISFDAAMQIAQEMVRRGEVVPYVDPPADGKVRVSFFAYVPLNEVLLEEEPKAENQMESFAM